MNVTPRLINHYQKNVSKSQDDDDDEFSAVLNRISSLKSGVKGVFSSLQVCLMLCHIAQDKASFSQSNPNLGRPNGDGQMKNAHSSQQRLSFSTKDQGTDYTQSHPNYSIKDGEVYSGLVLEDKPVNASADCAKVIEERYVTNDDINTMTARLLKAELSGNGEKIGKIKSKLDQLREAQRRNIKVRLTKTVPVSFKEAKHSRNFSPLATANKVGRAIPLYIKESEDRSFGKNYERGNCHDKNGFRTRYLCDDGNRYTVDKMIRQEKLEPKSSCDRQFAALANRCIDGVDEEYDSTFLNSVTLQGVLRSHRKSDAITDYKRREYAESVCPSCMDHTPRYLVMSVRHRMFLSLPEYVSLTRGHCLLTPLEHVGAMTRADEGAVDEACAFKRDLCRMAALWKGKGASYIFMEVAGYSDSFKHHVQIECVPVGRETMDELPPYFKKAMLDLGSEWDQNKRIIDLRQPGTGAYKAIPPNFAYFCVEFGIDGGGYAKVIENWSTFSLHFGREVLAGVMGISAEKWRKPKRDSMEQLRTKAVEFEKKWATIERSTHEQDGVTHRTKVTATITSTARCDLEPEGPELPP
ncbi:CWF19 protein 2 [Echinococcus multilocularis]|uniref:CWF19 protein 2 n=1 Tax=Echinococcus multilocularis TaxID=6211 RepID=A0A068YB51_ECHMU|nr:CWF19 protein 2 [Echinococcus multilocularis]